MHFYSELIKTILQNAGNHFSAEENHDVYRFGKPEKYPVTIKGRIRKMMEKILKSRGFYVVKRENFSANNLDGIDGYFHELDHLYDLLADDSSKNLLLQLIAYRILGPSRVKLPLSKPAYWEGITAVETLADHSNFIKTKFMNWRLSLIDLKSKGIPVKLYFSALGAYTDFLLRQYEYHNGNKIIRAADGDYVIDAGGCWGDTALYFANEVGPEGKVFTYEFIPSNIEIMNRNFSLNPSLQQRISLIEHPVWDKSGETMYYIDEGPGSRVFMQEEKNCTGNAASLSIDDLVCTQHIPRIDFIKMDVEGAEPFALKGAKETIKQFKPTLAIAIYHSLDDFVNIPRFIENLGLGYRMYLSHCSIHEEETILFAEIPDR